MKIINELPPETKKGQMVSLDFETFGQTEGKLHRPNGTFACISIAVESDPNVYQMYDDKDLFKLKHIIKKGTWVFHNALYDLRQFRRYTDIAPRFIWDVMLADQSMYGGYYQKFSLGDLSRRWLMKLIEKDTRTDFYTATEMTPAMKKYAAIDAIRTLEIALKQREEYTNDPAWQAYLQADEPMIFPILDMPGIRVDVGKWTKMVEGFQKKAIELEEELGFNPKSWQQVITHAKKYGIHLINTAHDTLVGVDHPFTNKVVEARLYRDAVSKYGLTWLEKHVESDGLVYSDYHIDGASQTGRMSSSDPNAQNIPQRKLPQYRSNFIASLGHGMEIDDVHQQEPTILAWESQDAELLKAINNGEDLHLAVARAIFDNPKLTKKNDKERDFGKTINLGTSYGLSAYGLMGKAHISENEANAFLKKYFAKFSGVASWITQERRNGYSLGWVSTSLGRRSFLNPYDKKWQNNAINSPIQGGAADLMKMWGRGVWEKSRRAGIPYTTVGFIHDEIVRDTPKEIIRESRKIKQEAFEEATEKLYPGVPFKFDSVVGKSWGAKKIKAELLEIEDD